MKIVLAFTLQQNKYFPKNYAFKMLCYSPRWLLETLTVFNRLVNSTNSPPEFPRLSTKDRNSGNK